MKAVLAECVLVPGVRHSQGCHPSQAKQEGQESFLL